MDRQELKAQVMACSWPELAPHFARGGLLLLSPGLDLLEAAKVIAGDDASALQGLLDSNGLTKLDDEQARDFESRKGSIRFQFLILQPYVLAQEILQRPDPKAN